jgi:hypothetical protein
MVGWDLVDDSRSQDGRTAPGGDRHPRVPGRVLDEWERVTGSAELFLGGHQPQCSASGGPLSQILRPGTRHRLHPWKDLPNPGRLLPTETARTFENAEETVQRHLDRSTRRLPCAAWAWGQLLVAPACDPRYAGHDRRLRDRGSGRACCRLRNRRRQ